MFNIYDYPLFTSPFLQSIIFTVSRKKENKQLLGLRRSLIRQTVSSLIRQRNINGVVALAPIHDVPRVKPVCLRDAHKDTEGRSEVTGTLGERGHIFFR